MNDEASTGFGPALEGAAYGFQALAHAAQAVTFRSMGAATVIGNFQCAGLLVPRKADTAALRLCVPDNVGHRFT